MLLQLKHTNSVQHQTAAAFLRGKAPSLWLEEINRWEISPLSLTCYIIPVSRQSVEPAGLLVIFKDGARTKLALKDPYGIIANRLLVPVHAILQPEVKASELEAQWLYDWQLLHPVIGMVGFNDSDQLDLSGLLSYSEAQEVDWSLAKSGVLSMAKLTEIKVEQPSSDEVLEALRELIDPKHLSDMPRKEEEGTNAVEEMLNKFSKSALQQALRATRNLNDKLWDMTSDSTSNVSGDEDGLLGKVENWILKKLEELEKKRNAEIDRLLKLFEDNPEEALKYSIPLEGPYAGRGIAPPSSRLFRHGTNFNLRGLGGGRRVDAWNIAGTNYQNLRAKYQKAAQQLIKAKDFRKAAYIYAHLLGDFRSAANVLVQGKHYREAAVLYKDHLKNISAAANCLEQGGLYLEAIDLYLEIGMHERAAYAYDYLGQDKQAQKQFEITVTKALKNDDYLHAVRLVADKLKQPERARELLLEAWNVSEQGEACLKQYFNLIKRTAPKKVDQEIIRIFDHQTPKEKENTFLNVLLDVNAQLGNDKPLDASRTIAYKILSAQIKNGQLDRLKTLKQFVPNDRLIASDCHRFKQQAKKPTPLKKTKPISEKPRFYEPRVVYHLDTSIKWIEAKLCQNQLVALGVKNSNLHLARGNWEGQFEYYSWNIPIEEVQYYKLVNPLRGTKRIVLLAGIGLANKKLPANQHFFHSIDVISAFHFGQGKGVLGMVQENDHRVSAIRYENQALVMDRFNLGERLVLEQSFDCQMDDIQPVKLAVNTMPSEAFLRHKHYYFVNRDALYRISEKGMVERFALNAMATHLIVSPPNSAIRIVVATNKGCLFFRLNFGKLEQVGHFFAEEMEIVNHMAFVPGGGLVIAGKEKIAVFNANSHQDTPQLKGSFIFKGATVAVLPYSRRNQCAILSEKGRLALYDI